MELLNQIPEILTQFIIVLLFSLLIGLEQRRQQNVKEGTSVPFGTDRTFTFIGLLGFILYILDPHNFVLFILGALLLGIFFGIYYYKKIDKFKAFGITKMLVGLITYSLAPIVITQEKWVSILIVVSVLILVESKSYLLKFSNKFASDEFVTLAKFLIIAGVILPVLPDTPISDSFNISPYQIWLSLVVIAGISYFSYLLQKFVFRKSGLILSGMLGGLYSSTATTLILSKKSREANNTTRLYGASILIATSMMYLRVLILMLIFNYTLAMLALPYIVVLFIILFGIALILFFSSPKTEKGLLPVAGEKNPLELKIALIFSLLFLLFSFLTNYTLKTFGEPGLNVLSYIVGFTDIDPFLLNLFQGKFLIGITFIAKASFQAIISNNILKIIVTLILADKVTKKIVFAGLGLVTLINILMLFLL
jgi:uncharacterized membrane protein (DUF4010 family)